MKKIGALVLTFVIIAVSIVGMWVYQSWKEEQELTGTKDIYNVYIVKESGDKITVYSSEGSHEYVVKKDMEEQEYRGIGDLTLQGERVEKLIRKPEQITGKVLSIQVETMDIEQYGSLPMDTNCTCYTVNGEVKVASKEELYIGQTDAAFAVAQGKICSILLPAKPEIETADVGGDGASTKGDGEKEEQRIRVLIKTDGHVAYEHGEVRVSGTGKITVQSGKEKTEYAAGEEVRITPESMKEKRVTIQSEENEKIQLLSIQRNGGNPSYRGDLEIVKAEGGFHIINDLPVEQYLYGVIPSEMPASYESEALKAQAVCARSYALLHIHNNRLKGMGAHVDDSMSYQVYQNTPEDERCSQAVDATKGERAMYEGKIASTYFFSTSCGVTTSSQDVSFTTKKVPYLTGKLLEPDFLDENQRERARLVSDTFGETRLFRKFLEEEREVLEKAAPWYRWSTTISLEDLENNINAKLGERCEVAGDKIQVRQPDGTYGTQGITSIGKLKRIRIPQRKSGGVASMAVLVGSDAVVRVYSEYNIRTLLFHEKAIVRKNDGTNVSGMSMLPSGFFVLDKSGSSYEIKGGGFGHGTGMSQTGANELAAAGKTYKEILTYYFDGVDVTE